MGSRRSKSVTIQLTSEHEHDFWARVDRSDEGGCWIWTGYKDKNDYPSLKIDKERLGAPRVAWVLHHRQPLPSYQQVRRRCQSKGCVRPTHMKRVPTKYATFAARNPNSTFTVLKPPEGGKTEAPRQEVVVALSGSFKELQQIRAALHTVTAALPQTDSKQQKSHEKTQGCITELTASVESLREEMLRWTAKVDQRMLRMERALEPVKPDPEPSHPEPSHPKAEPSQPAAKPNGGRPKDMTAVLMSAFQAELGVPENPTDDDYESLDMVFDIALGEVQEPSAAVNRFGSWLSSFHNLTRTHPATEPTPQSFAREVAARRLDG